MFRKPFLTCIFAVLVAPQVFSASAPLPLVNGDFEANSDGSLIVVGWAQASPEDFVVEADDVPFSPPSPYEGTKFITSHIDSGANPSDMDSVATQRVDLFPWAAAIDAGLASVDVSGQGWGVTAGSSPDSAMLLARFYDSIAGGALLGSPFQSESATGPNITDPVWQAIQIEDALVPPGSRSLEIELRTYRTGGISTNAGFDAIRAQIDTRTSGQVIPEPLTALAVLGACTSLGAYARRRSRAWSSGKSRLQSPSEMRGSNSPGRRLDLRT